MKRILFLLLINSCLYGSYSRLEKEDATYSSFHAQGTITNLTNAEISITFLQKSHIHQKMISQDSDERVISENINVQPRHALEIDKDATSVQIRTTEFPVLYTSKSTSIITVCLISPTHSYSIQKSDVIMLVDEATNEIILDRRYYR